MGGDGGKHWLGNACNYRLGGKMKRLEAKMRNWKGQVHETLAIEQMGGGMGWWVGGWAGGAT